MDNDQIKNALMIVCFALLAFNQLITTLQMRRHHKMWDTEVKGKMLELQLYASFDNRIARLEKTQDK